MSAMDDDAKAPLTVSAHDGHNGSGHNGSTEYAVIARHVQRSYGRGKKQVHVLKDLNLTLPVGHIYGLLGPSGCGKTTFLKLVLGLLVPHGGWLHVFGRRPGTDGHSVPGPDVGFMPQEVALYLEFSILEALRYSARLFGMTEEHFQERKRFLMEFLDLPDELRLISALSGGQKRRVSLALAMLHNPKLLILDEPTVGVDPLLRAKIWQYLVRIAKGGTTIIVTTHYIEEAALSNTVGLMRDGRLLAEGSPAQLQQTYNKTSLEDVFLSLCMRQGDDPQAAALAAAADGGSGAAASGGFEPARLPDSGAATPVVNAGAAVRASALSLNGGQTPLLSSVASTQQSGAGGGAGGTAGRDLAHDDPEPGDDASRQQTCFESYAPRARVAKAEIMKNFNRMRRNYGFLLFQFLVPSIQVALFCLAVGKPPQGIHVCVANLDAPNAGPLSLATQVTNHFVNDNGNAFILDQFQSYDDAVGAVRRGDCWSAVYFSPTYTADLIARFVGHSNSTAVLEGSTVQVRMDESNQQISVFIAQALDAAFQAMASAITPNAQLPILVGDPVYGPKNPVFTDFIAPGMIITIAFAQSIGLTAVAFVMDKKSGCLDRCWAAGVRPSEIMCAQLCSQTANLAVQMGLLLVVALAIFQLPMEGSYVAVLTLSLLMGLTGMMMGLVISSVCEEEREAMQLALGSFFPAQLLSGIIWPIEAVPKGLRWLSYCLPTTWAAGAMRSIMSRGWGITHYDVWIGYVVAAVWVSFFFILAIRGLKSGKS